MIEFNTSRIILDNKIDFEKGTVIYWMSREQRIDDNWSLIYAQDIAQRTNSKLVIVFALIDEFLDSLDRNFKFMIDGLIKVKENANKLNIPFSLLRGNPEEEILKFVNNFDNYLIVTDFDPIRLKRLWQTTVMENTNQNLTIIDSHNIVPCTIASDKQEYAAYTIRPKITSKLDEYLTDFIEMDYHQLNDMGFFYKYNIADFPKTDSENEISWLVSGEDFATRILKEFIDTKLDDYKELKNKPKNDVLSNLSPYLHFGQISSQRIALSVSKSMKNDESKDSFIEELIVRKELADNFCYFNLNYDNFEGFPEWAKVTLSKHQKDKRQYIYSLDKLESGKTHDKLWNYSQNQMVREGKMHGYLRMYWAKKILEWSENAEIALQNAILLNNKYELDGRDPNGYAGIAWSIGGVHDRPWGERPIFGMIRFMSYNSQIKKVDFNENLGLFK
jgi:deoxyribodipyrimidine photo-lyase